MLVGTRKLTVQVLCTKITPDNTTTMSFNTATTTSNNGWVHFYRAMHFSAKRGIAIACRLSVCPSVHPSVCDVGELWSHRLEFFKNNFTIS